MYPFSINFGPVSQIGLQPTKMWEKMVQGEIRLCSGEGNWTDLAAASSGGDGD